MSPNQDGRGSRHEPPLWYLLTQKPVAPETLRLFFDLRIIQRIAPPWRGKPSENVLILSSEKDVPRFTQNPEGTMK